MPQNGHLYDTNIGVTAITPTGSTVKWTPAARRNAYLELDNFDAFVGTAGGCNALPDGKSAHQVFIRAEPQPLAAPPHCAAILDASPAAPSGVYSVHLDGSPEGSTQQVYCDMENGGYMHCGTGAAGASLSVELLRQENSDIVDRCVRTMLVGGTPNYNYNCLTSLPPLGLPYRRTSGFSRTCMQYLTVGAHVSFSTSS